MKTIRQQIISLLDKEELSVRELSQILGEKEKEVNGHLPHIRRTIISRKRKFVVTPSVCLDCGYEFKDRRRLTRPGRCPRCKTSHVRGPSFRIVH